MSAVAADGATAPRPLVPIVVSVRDEARTLAACLRALAVAARAAERALPLRFALVVVLDRCTDGSEALARRAPGLRVLQSAGVGKVAAQRTGVAAYPDAPFYLFSDADVLPREAAVTALAQALWTEPRCFAAHPRFVPLRPRRVSPLACALHIYNLRRGFERAPPAWIPGRFFALRRFELPDEAAVRAALRERGLGAHGFYCYERGLVVDDVLLSRRVRALHGPAAIAHVPAAVVHYGAPETLRGMYRYYRRLRWELERCDAMFPALRGAHTARVTAPRRRAAAPLHERAALALFDAALLLCRGAYRVERAARSSAPNLFDPWPPLRESKASPLFADAGPLDPARTAR